MPVLLLFLGGCLGTRAKRTLEIEPRYLVANQNILIPVMIFGILAGYWLDISKFLLLLVSPLSLLHVTDRWGGGGGGGTPLFGLYGKMPLHRVWFFGLAVLNKVYNLTCLCPTQGQKLS